MSNVLKTLEAEVHMLSNVNVNFVTSLMCVSNH